MEQLRLVERMDPTEREFLQLEQVSNGALGPNGEGISTVGTITSSGALGPNGEGFSTFGTMLQ